jgi:PAS domain S-box-containing protein
MLQTKIFIVEDEPLVAKDLQQSLRGLGYDVPAAASSGMEAIRRARQVQPDLVLMDIVLKGKMDGVEAAKHIQTELNIPVVFVTACGDDKTFHRAKASGPMAYVTKPFQLPELRRAIEISLEQHRKNQDIRREQHWFLQTLKAVGEALIITDREGYVKFMNPLAEALTGWAEPEAIGKHLEEVFTLYREDEAAERDLLVSRVVHEDLSVLLRNMTLLAKNLSKHAVEGNAAPIKDESGVVIGTVLTFYPSDRAGEASRPSLGACEGGRESACVENLGAWVPICSACKKVRDQIGNWHQLESYFTDVWKFCFTHGMCPECLSRWYRRLGS